MAILYFISLVFGFWMTTGYVTDRALRSRGHRGESSDHFDGTRFFNYRTEPVIIPGNHRPTVLKWMLTRPKNNWKARALDKFAKPVEKVNGRELIVTYVNHSTVLIQTQGLNILTDPVWSKRASPFSFLGPARYTPPGIKMEDLPKIDAILLSHNHYDHMDINTLRELYKRWQPKIFTSLGNAGYLAKRGIFGASDMDWWDEETIGPIKVIATPAQHFSARALSDRNKTLWCGFILQTGEESIYFAGDTGYGPFIEQIKKRFNGFRLALIPIGAYKPEWFMSPVHVSPKQALQMHEELKCAQTIAIHHSTFHLADDEQDEPAEVLSKLTAQMEPMPNFHVLLNGESTNIP